MGDTCRALEGFQKNPYNNSLSSILPCQQLLAAKPTLNNASAEIHNLVNKVSKSTFYRSIYMNKQFISSSIGFLNPFYFERLLRA